MIVGPWGCLNGYKQQGFSRQNIKFVLASVPSLAYAPNSCSSPWSPRSTSIYPEFSQLDRIIREVRMYGNLNLCGLHAHTKERTNVFPLVNNGCSFHLLSIILGRALLHADGICGILGWQSALSLTIGSSVVGSSNDHSWWLWWLRLPLRPYKGRCAPSQNIFFSLQQAVNSSSRASLLHLPPFFSFLFTSLFLLPVPKELCSVISYQNLYILTILSSCRST